MGRTINQRRAPRHNVAMPAVCRTGTGRQGDVTIVDLTAEGCRVFTLALPLSTGIKLRIRPRDFESLPGVVRWVNRGFAGIEFDKPLYGPVADHLQKVFNTAR